MMHCRSAGDQARYQYVTSAAVEPAMLLREGKFATAQSAYLDARVKAEPILGSVRTEFKKIQKELECILGNEEIGRIKAAWHHTLERLERCAGKQGPCIDDNCKFEHDVEHDSTPELLAHQAKYGERVTAAEARFDALEGEPARLTARVAALKEEKDALVDGMGADAASINYPLLYVKLLVGWYHLDNVYVGFTSASAYDDCLRKCLRCSVHGRRALTEIVGELAVRTCRKQKHETRCQNLRTHLADETMAELTEHSGHSGAAPA